MNTRLRLKKSGDSYKVYVVYTHKNKEYAVSTGLSLDAKFWDDKQKRVKRSSPHYKLQSQIIAKKEQDVMSAALELKAEGIEPWPAAVKERLNKGKAKAVEFWEAWEKFKDFYYPTHTENTIDKFDSLERLMKDFEKTQGGLYRLSFDKLDKRFGAKFRLYLQRDRGNVSQTQATRVKQFRTFMGFCFDEKYIRNKEYENWSIKFKSANQGIIFTPDELQLLINAPLKHSRHIRIRDLTLLHVLTGARYSEAKWLNYDAINDNNCICILERKQTEIRDVYLHPRAIQILKKYGVAPQYSNQKFNKYIKEVCKIAGIDSPVIYRGESVPKYKAITTHVGRKTFASTLHGVGQISVKEVQEIIGHSSVTQTEGYVVSLSSKYHEAVNSSFKNVKLEGAG